MMRFKPLVLVSGADEIGTGIIHRLYCARFRVAVTASDDPMILIRGNDFTRAAYSGTFEVEGVTVQKAVVTEALGLIDRDSIPFLTADARSVVDILNPEIVIDARPAAKRGDISVGDASLVIGIGQGFAAGTDCDLAVQSDRGYDMGRIVFRGPIKAVDADEDSESCQIALKAENSGVFMPLKRLGQPIEKGEAAATVGKSEIQSLEDGVISGILREGLEVSPGTPVMEVDRRGREEFCYMLSDRCRAISGGVLEAVVAWTADVGGFPQR